MDNDIFLQLLNRFEIETGLSIDLVGASSKYNMYEITMHIDFDEEKPSLTIEDFGYDSLGKWTQLNYNDFQYSALSEKMEELVNNIEEQIRVENH